MHTYPVAYQLILADSIPVAAVHEPTSHKEEEDRMEAVRPHHHHHHLPNKDVCHRPCPDASLVWVVCGEEVHHDRLLDSSCFLDRV